MQQSCNGSFLSSSRYAVLPKVNKVKERIALCHGETGGPAVDALRRFDATSKGLVTSLTAEVRNCCNKQYEGMNSNLEQRILILGDF
jgi:hypothetical protein